MNRKRDQGEELPSPRVQALFKDLEFVPDPDAEAWETGRRAFLSEAAVLAKARESALAAVTSEPKVRRKAWIANIQNVFTLRWKETPMLALLKVALVLSVIFGGTAGTVAAAQQSLPGSTLYPVKLQVEDWRLAATQDPAKEANLAMAMAQKRVEEAVKLGGQQDEIPVHVAERYQSQVNQALQATGTLSGPLQLQMQAGISQTLASQIRTMEQLMQRLQKGAGEDEGQTILIMVQTMRQAQLRVGGKPEAPPSGENVPYQKQEQYQGGPGEGTEESQGPRDGYGECEGDCGGFHNEDNNGNGPNEGQCEGDCGGSNNDTGNGKGPGEGQCEGDCGGPNDDTGENGNGPGEGQCEGDCDGSNNDTGNGTGPVENNTGSDNQQGNDTGGADNSGSSNDNGGADDSGGNDNGGNTGDGGNNGGGKGNGK